MALPMDGFAHPSRPFAVKSFHAAKTNVSRFEKAVYGIRNKELMYNRDLPQMQSARNANAADRIRGYGVVASLCSRFVETEQNRAARFEERRKASPRFRRREPRPDYSRQSKPRVSHQEVTRQLLKQAIDGSDFALLNIIIRMSPCVKDYLEGKDEQGNTLLHRTCLQRNHRLAVVLVDLGLDVNREGEQNRTPLHFAALQDDINTVRLLLNSCADVLKKDIEGSRPVDLCSDPGIRSLLLTRMNTRTRSFNTKRNRSKSYKSDVDLCRTDSGIVMENINITNADRNMKIKKGYSHNECMSSFRDFRFSKETVV